MNAIEDTVGSSILDADLIILDEPIEGRLEHLDGLVEALSLIRTHEHLLDLLVAVNILQQRQDHVSRVAHLLADGEHHVIQFEVLESPQPVQHALAALQEALFHLALHYFQEDHCLEVPHLFGLLDVDISRFGDLLPLGLDVLPVVDR